jgi:hypothetical protein
MFMYSWMIEGRIKGECVQVYMYVHELNAFLNFKSCQAGRTQTVFITVNKRLRKKKKSISVSLLNKIILFRTAFSAPSYNYLI